MDGLAEGRLMTGKQVKQLTGIIELYDCWHWYDLGDDEVVDIVGMINAVKAAH